MKHKYLGRATIIALFTIAVQVWAQLPACQCLPQEILFGGDLRNKDSVRVDSCGFVNYRGDCEHIFDNITALVDIEEGGLYYAKKWWTLSFRFPVFRLPVLPGDSVVEVHWQDMDIQYSELRDSISSWEKKFGRITFVKLFPLADTGELSLDYRMYLQEYARAKDVRNTFFYKGRNGVEDTTYYYSTFGLSSSFVANQDTKVDEEELVRIQIAPNPVWDNLSIYNYSDKELPQVTVHDITGRLVEVHQYKTTTTIILQLVSLQKGIYFLQIGNRVQKFIKY